MTDPQSQPEQSDPAGRTPSGDGAAIPLPPATAETPGAAPGATEGPAGWAPGGWTPAGWSPGPSGNWGPGPSTPPPGSGQPGQPGSAWGPVGSPWGPPGTGWTAPAAAQPPSGSRSRRSRLMGGAAVLTAAATLAGVGIGYAVWQPSGTAPTSAVSPVGPGSSSGSGSSGEGGSGAGGSFPGFGSGGSPFGTSGSGSSGSSRSSGGSTSSAAGSPSNLSAIAAKVDPGLVDINTTLSYQNEQAAGTGMVLTSDGEVLTNNHVIEGATSISVTDIGNGKTYTASVVGYDRSDDVAVIQLHGASGLQTVTTGNSSNVAVGQGVVGIGNAGGAGGTPSVAGGSVTALDQSITASDQGDGTSEQLTGLIQVNCDIQPGDSGGPLVNTSGQVIGMDTAASESQGFTFQGATGQGYAIPINAALSLAKQIEAGHASSTVHIGQTAFLGVEVQSAAGSQGSTGGRQSPFGRSPFGGLGGRSGFGGTTGFGTGAGGFTSSSGTTTAATTTGTTGTSATGATGSSTAGAAVTGVVSGSPAQKAGLAGGDVITAVGGTSVGSADDLTSIMGGHHPGDKVQVTWTDSAGQSHTATVTLATGPAA